VPRSQQQPPQHRTFAEAPHFIRRTSTDLPRRDTPAPRLIIAPNIDDPAENQAREQLLTQHRECGTRTGRFDGFPHDVRWEWMGITPAELATARYVDYGREVQHLGVVADLQIA